jgi:hypothetical protein
LFNGTPATNKSMADTTVLNKANCCDGKRKKDKKNEIITSKQKCAYISRMIRTSVSATSVSNRYAV